MTDSEFSIDPITESELDAICEIETQSFTSPWTRNQFKEELVCTHSTGICGKEGRASDRQRIIGYVCYRLILDEMHIFKIAVSPCMRRKGVGKWLLENSIHAAAAQGAAQSFLDVNEANTLALALYAKLGFTCIGRRRGYYDKTHEDALVLMKCLKEAL